MEDGKFIDTDTWYANEFERGIGEFRKSLGSKGFICWSPFLLVHKGYGIFFDTFRDNNKLFVRYSVSDTNISGSTLLISDTHEGLVEKVKVVYNEVVKQLDSL